MHEMIRISHAIACPIVFILLCNLDWHGEVLKLIKMVNFKYFRPLWFVSSIFLVGSGADHTGFCIYCESMLYSYAPNGYNFSLRSRSGGRSAQTYEKCLNLSIFSRLGLFL